MSMYAILDQIFLGGCNQYLRICVLPWEPWHFLEIHETEWAFGESSVIVDCQSVMNT